MKNLVIGLLISAFFLTACGETPPVTQAAPMTATETSITPKLTSTPLPSKTPREPRNEPTTSPIPSPTATPTFDVSMIVTVTPGEQAICPISQPAVNLNFDFLNLQPGLDWDNREKAEENTLNFLNTYGAQSLVNYLMYNYGTEGKHFIYKDITNDGVPELAISLTSFFIFGCKSGKYVNLFEFPPDGYLRPPSIISIEDNNRNGIPELTMLLGFMSQGGHDYGIYEWNQTTFHSLVLSDHPDYPESGSIWAEATGEIHYEDLNHDSVPELVLDSGIPVWSTYVDGLPWRTKRTIYQWDGQRYVPTHYEFAVPEFRFQAIQDGDLAFSQQEYDKALSLYQEAIFSDNLKGYSPEIRDNLRAQWNASYGTYPTPTPHPIAVDEYPRLAAYAYYRIMLIHLVQGYESDAGTVYNTLQQKFGDDPHGRPYAEMATAFWEAYQSTQRMYDGCAAAIQYAVEHPEILTPLGSDYHGSQSHVYVPADVCPFR